MKDPPMWKVLVLGQGDSETHFKTARIPTPDGSQAIFASGVFTGDLAQASLENYFASVAMFSGPFPVEETVMNDIRALTRRGIKVIGCGPGAGNWPMNFQCRAMLAGAVKLFDTNDPDFAPQLRQVLSRLLQTAREQREQQMQTKAAMRQCGIIGESLAIIEVFQKTQRLSALSDLPALITGETGTGKELLARAIHRFDPKRLQGPFIAINCGAISPDLAESELFGHRRGAYTGADRDRKGWIRAADGGVLFLDEIGELAPGLQAKLLRVLQEGSVLSVGEDREVPVNIRVIAATNRDLNGMIEAGTFRSDLFHRLNAVSIYIPPLRQRSADLKPLTEHFLRKYEQLSAFQFLTIEAGFLHALTLAELPGNVRQLENLVRSSLIAKTDGFPLSLGDLPREILRQLASPSAPPKPPEQIVPNNQMNHPPGRLPAINNAAELSFLLSNLMTSNNWSLGQLLDYFKDLLIQTTLQMSNGNQTEAARILRIAPRSIYNTLHKHGSYGFQEKEM